MELFRDNQMVKLGRFSFGNCGNGKFPGRLMPNRLFLLFWDWYLGTAWSAGTMSQTWLKSLC